MPSAIYQYVYYETLTVGGAQNRQNRNPATSSKYLPVPGILVPSTNVLATGSTFTPMFLRPAIAMQGKPIILVL